MSVGTMKPSFGGFSGQKFVPRTITLKVMSMSLWFCSMRSLKESVKSLLRLISTTLVSDHSTCKGERSITSEHALKLVRVFETASFFQLGDHARLCLIRCRYAVNETLGELCRVECLKYVLLLEVLEYDHLWNVFNTDLMMNDLNSAYHAIQRALKVPFLRHLIVLT
jgi:hypothetical protein